MSFLGQTTTAFDFGSMAQTSFQSGTEGGGFDTGDAAGAALDAAASAIPFGTMVKDFLDKLGLQENIDNVLKYGLSSWGASASPEELQAQWGQKVLPYVQAELQKITGSNLIPILENLTNQLLANHHFHIALRDNHSNAKSTRLANDWAQKEYLKLSNEIFTGIQAQFASKGVKISRTQVDVNERQEGYIRLLPGDQFGDRTYDNYIDRKYWKLSVDTSSIKEVIVDEHGVVKEKSSFGFIGIAGLAFAAFKAFK